MWKPYNYVKRNKLIYIMFPWLCVSVVDVKPPATLNVLFWTSACCYSWFYPAHTHKGWWGRFPVLSAVPTAPSVISQQCINSRKTPSVDWRIRRSNLMLSEIRDSAGKREPEVCARTAGSVTFVSSIDVTSLWRRVNDRAKPTAWSDSWWRIA